MDTTTTPHATTRTRWVPTYDVSSVREAVAKLNARIAKKGLGTPIECTVGPVELRRDSEFDSATPQQEVTIRWAGTVAVEGGWQLVACADFASTDTPLVYNLDDDIDLRAADVTTECDHCHTSRRRHDVFIVRNEAGDLRQVGRNCVVDFLAHDAERLLSVMRFLDDLDDEDRMWGGGGGDGSVPTEVFVRAARAAVMTYGWVKSSDWERTPTRQMAYGLLMPIKGDSRSDVEAREAQELAWSDEVGEYAAAAIEWAAALSPKSDFDENLQAVARSERLGHKALGIAAYLPVAYARHLDAEAERKVESERRAALPSTPVPEGRNVVTGTILSLKDVASDYGVTEKMVVEDERGFRVYVTVPSGLHVQMGECDWRGVRRGDRVTFTATLERSKDDETFGFGKRPTKASVVEPAAA